MGKNTRGLMMRIVLIGQAAFGEAVLKSLSEKGETVVGVYAPADARGRTDPLKEAAVKLVIPVFQYEGLRRKETYAEYAGLKPDLNVMAFVTDIIPESILNHPQQGTIQYHPSLLPKHRGGRAINWAVLTGETRTGITIFWPDKGIDTGPVLLQKEVDIAPDDTVGSLYFNKLFPLGVAALIESIDLIKKGSAPRIPQDESQASYEGLCTENDAVINWNQPVAEVYNLIRGTNPQPGAITHFKGERVKVFDAELIKDGAVSTPGEVNSITDQGFIVSAADGAIFIKRVQPQDSSKIPAAEFVNQTGLKAGDRLD